MTVESRRTFNVKMLGSLLAYGLIETLHRGELFADSVKPTIDAWLKDLAALSQDLKNQKVKDIDFQAKLEELYRKVDLKELMRLVQLEKLTKDLKYPDKGAANLGIDLSKVEGLPKIVFGKQIFALSKGRSIVPHGHDNMCTGFIILRGNFVGKHWERVEDNADHYLIQPTIDRVFKPGEVSTISDNKDNVHWFKAEDDAAAVFNMHITGYNPANKKNSSRVYIDPAGEKTAGGLIKAMKITSKEAHEKYG